MFGCLGEKFKGRFVSEIKSGCRIQKILLPSEFDLKGQRWFVPRFNRTKANQNKVKVEKRRRGNLKTQDYFTIITDFTARPCRGRQIPQVSHLFLLWKENKIFLILNCLDQNVGTNVDNKIVRVAVAKMSEALGRRTSVVI